MKDNDYFSFIKEIKDGTDKEDKKSMKVISLMLYRDVSVKHEKQ